MIGAVLTAGRHGPASWSRARWSRACGAGTVVVDVSIDQGGCFETSRPTTHSNPTYVVDGVVHYCVTNMPGAVARTSTFALNNATLPFTLALADKGYRGAMAADSHLRDGLNVFAGKVTYEAVAAGARARVRAAREGAGPVADAVRPLPRVGPAARRTWVYVPGLPGCSPWARPPTQAVEAARDGDPRAARLPAPPR